MQFSFRVSDVVCLSFVLALLGGSAEATPFSDQLLQSSQIKAPSRGSLAGEYGSTTWGAQDLSRGTFSLSLGIQFPNERGSLVFFPDLQYSPSLGISELGIGTSVDLSIRRYRVYGSINYKDDDLLSPWGHLVRGNEGDYFSRGLKIGIRVRFASEEELQAFLPDGRTLIFGRENVLKTRHGIYSWYLTQAKDSDHHFSRYHYEMEKNHFYIKTIQYGGNGDDFQNQIVFDYDPLGKPFIDYRSGARQELTRQLSQIDVQTKSNESRFLTRYSYRFKFKFSGINPGFVVSRVQKIYPSGEVEPEKSFEFDEAERFLDQTQWKKAKKLSPILEEYGRSILTEKEVSFTDPNSEGLTSIELPKKDFALLRQTAEGYRLEELPPRDAKTGVGEIYHACRNFRGNDSSPRYLVKLRGPGGPTEVVRMIYDVDTNLTKILVCTREGELTGNLVVAGDWRLGQKTRLVDLDHDGKPELFRIHAGKYWVLRNLSTNSKIEFASNPIVGSLGISAQEEPRSILIQDLNGDGIPDIIGQYDHYFKVWYGNDQFEFVMEDAKFPVIDKSGTRVQLRSGMDFLFQDVNGDGIPELIIYSLNHISMYFFDGQQFLQRSLPALSEFYKNKWASPTSIPVPGDFTGSGNSQLTMLGQDGAYALEFNEASSGLLRFADDGKGNKLTIEYQRAKPEEQIGFRPTIVKSMSLETTGKGVQKFGFSFNEAKTHSVSQALLGFNHVLVSQKHGEQETKFYHDDVTPTLEVRSSEVDLRQAQLKRVTLKKYDSTEFKGIPFSKLIEEESGFDGMESALKVSSKIQYLNYNEDLCPLKTSEISIHGTLVTEKSYEKPPQLAEHLTCLETEIHLTGIHSESRADFKYDLRVIRDSLGHPLVLKMDGEGGRVLQYVGYRDDYRLHKIQIPGRGSTFFNYDSSYRLISVQKPDGVRVEAEYSESPLELISKVQVQHGGKFTAQGLHQESFNYDGLGRLSSRWDNLTPSSQETPIEGFRYHYATPNQPGWISTVQNLFQTNQNSQTVSREKVHFHTGDGKEMGIAFKSEQGWVIDGLRWEDPRERRSQIFASRLLTNEPYGAAVSDLISNISNASMVRDESRTLLGFRLEQERTYQQGVKGVVKASAEATGQGLEFNYLENNLYSILEHQDLNGRRTFYQDGEGIQTTFQYDVLGRISEVLLGNDIKHQVRYDDQGRVQEIQRTHVSKVRFYYKSQTDLIELKSYLTPRGRLSRTVEFRYDEVGRVIQQIQTSYLNGKPLQNRVFHYFYDGKVPDGPKLEGQVGFLTAVQGPDFLRVQKYRADGRVLNTTLRIPGWKTLSQTLEYYSDGTLKSKETEQRNNLGGFVEKPILIFEEYGLDPLGRTSTYSVAGSSQSLSPLAKLSYDAYSQMHKVHLQNGSVYDLDRDPLTQSLMGIKSSGSDLHVQNQWRFNQRGLVEEEEFALNEQSIFRSYSYLKNGFLKGYSDQKDSQGYQYDSIGIIHGIIDSDGLQEIQPQYQYPQNQYPQYQSVLTPLSWKSVSSSRKRVQEFKVDSLGRFKGFKEAQVSYGPSGRVERLKKADKIFSYSYDEAGKRIFKKEGSSIVESYFGGSVITSQAVYTPIKMGGVHLGLLENSKFIPLALDQKGSSLQDRSGKLSVLSSYGERKEAPSQYSNILEYVSQGYDPDLQAYRMELRDYDPVLKRFHTPDPLFLEQPENCVESPLECNLFSYARGNPVTFVDPTGLYVNSSGKELQGPAPQNRVEARQYDSVASFHAFDVNGRDARGIKVDPIPEMVVTTVLTGGVGLIPRAGEAVIAQGEKSFLFQSSKLAESHFLKHGEKVAEAFGTNPSYGQYMAGANKVLSEGTHVPALNGVYKMIDSNRAGFVGLSQDTSSITTFHIKELSDFGNKVLGALKNGK